MSAKTRIVVLHMREVIYTAIFAALAILLILLLVFMFRSGKKDSAAQETMKYVSGVYTSSIVLNNQTMDLKVVVDDNRINACALDEVLHETAATMYPLMQPALDHISQQIYEKQSTENITYEEANQYTSVVLLNAIKNALSRAEVKEEGR